MKVALLGSSGRLGSEIKNVLLEQNIGSVELGRKDVVTSGALAKALNEPVIVLDASLPEGTEALCHALSELNHTQRSNIKGVVIGSTGHSISQLAAIEKCSATVPVCLVSNFSSGIFLFEQILQAKTESGKTVVELARELGFDLALSEIHHTRKKDAPSGTAKTLGAAAAIDESRMSAVRVGAVVGEHEIIFSGEAEELRVRHVALTRRLFALGAVRLAKKMFARHYTPGLLSRGEVEF